ncbi:MAG: GntR family transcriptional regulator [Actinomycetes bacterium]
MIGTKNPASEPPPTLTEWADQQLRASILDGDYRPGDSLVISTLSEQLNLSATPLREALRKLAAEGLVVLQSHGSARVSEVDLHEANEIYEMRLLLEPMALERAVEAGDAAYRGRVEATWSSLTSARIASASDHAAFHRALLSACDSAWLLRLATMLSDRASLMITVGLPDRPAAYETSTAHRTLMELTIAGNAAGAAKELHRHLSQTLDALCMVLDGGTTVPG